ncbi:protein grindelwald isoform X1 [Venturia canescens]|uniref:protein grindelwald isoform X1 n=1 Tax=Venturia canescens TaxID=32260 RepID=UPI001C9C4AC6|nr:protein grindelwald isoform X1 [Venturia canescens]
MRILWLIGIVIIVLTDARLNHEGTKCGQQLCTTTEYCSPFDSQCRQCSTICNASNHNHQIELCEKDCQEYLHDRRYVLRVEMSRVEILKAEIDRLTTLVKVSLTLTIMATVLALILGGKIFIKLQRIRSAVQKIFGRSWTKKTTSSNNGRDDVEVGVAKQNGLKLTMPTISATLKPSLSTNGDSTPTTTSTPLSRRYPTEDKTLDFAYDNPAMTPSSESV